MKNWFETNRKKIGYVVGGLNLLAGLSYFSNGATGPGLLWIVIGIFLIYDTWEYK
jgi:hypothetical protein